MLTPYERETIILYNQGEKEASVYTFDPKLIRRLKKLAEKYPDEVRLEQENKNGSCSYIVPKECVLVREPYSKERREAARQRALKNGSVPPARGSVTTKTE